MAPDAPATNGQTCRNCEGIDPASCLFCRARRPAPAADRPAPPVEPAPTVERCNWCSITGRPNPAHHPGGQAAHTVEPVPAAELAPSVEPSTDTAGCAVRRVPLLDIDAADHDCEETHRYYTEGFLAAVSECEARSAARDAELAKLREAYAAAVDDNLRMEVALAGQATEKDATVPYGEVEAWLKAQRDRSTKYTARWTVVDDLLDDYRLHMQTETPLTEHAHEGSHCCADGAS